MGHIVLLLRYTAVRPSKEFDNDKVHKHCLPLSFLVLWHIAYKYLLVQSNLGAKLKRKHFTSCVQPLAQSVQRGVGDPAFDHILFIVLAISARNISGLTDKVACQH